MNALLARLCGVRTDQPQVFRAIQFPAGVRFPESIERPISFDNVGFGSPDSTRAIRRCRDIVFTGESVAAEFWQVTCDGSITANLRNVAEIVLAGSTVRAHITVSTEIGIASLKLSSSTVEGNCSLSGRRNAVAISASQVGTLVITSDNNEFSIDGDGGRKSRITEIRAEGRNFNGPFVLSDTEIAESLLLQGGIFHSVVRIENCSVGGSFLGAAVQLNKGLSFSNVDIAGVFDLSGADTVPAVRLLDFGRTEFRGEANFNSRSFADGALFHRCVFHRPPTFFGSRLHQDTTFPPPANFKDRTGSAVAAYRTLKEAMEKLRARHEEGTFYALEQRSRRARPGALGRVESATSLLYGLVSDYGQNFFRPVCWFFAIGGIFAGLYAYLRSQVFCWMCAPDGEAWRAGIKWSVEFSVNPFSVWRKDVDPHVPNWGALQMLATIQSLAALTLVALFLLALRWRFKRD